MTGATVCLTVDFDAVSSWIHSFDEGRSPTNLSRGLFGVDVGAPRLLDLFEKYDLSTKWFVPGHTVESFPAAVEDVWAAGHDIQHHGWTHTRPSNYDDRASERADIERGIDAIESLTGRAPTGYRSPSWDFEPYRLRENWSAPAESPFERGVSTDIVEVPVSWQRDDFPAFAFSRQRGYANEAEVFEMWRRQFDWMHRNVDGGAFVLTVHPQVIGQSHRLANLESLIEHVQAKSGVEFATVESVAEDFTAGSNPQ